MSGRRLAEERKGAVRGYSCGVCPMEDDKFTFCRSASLGVHCVAAQRFESGELILLEAPLVSTQSPVADGLPSASVEWFLVHALLSAGKSGAWAAQFCCDVRLEPNRDDEEVASWICSVHGCSVQETAALHAVVRCNAFGLESALLGVEYGAAFYNVACRFNHSCAPNCLSIRIGGNMAIFAAGSIAAGEELRHSYLPPRLLVAPTTVRQAHLHFACACTRCASEPQPPSASLAQLGFPPGHARTAQGVEIGVFKLATASPDVEAIVEAGITLFSNGATDGLVARPLAAIDVAAPFLSAYFSRQRTETENEDELRDKRAHVPRDVAALDAAWLLAGATERLREAYVESAHTFQLPVCDRAARGAAPRAHVTAVDAAELLADMSLVSARLLGQRHQSAQEQRSKLGNAVYHAIDAAATASLRRLCGRFGGSLEWIRDDLPGLCPSNRTMPELLRASLEDFGGRTSTLELPQATRAVAATAGLGLIHPKGASTWTFVGQRCSAEALLVAVGAPARERRHVAHDSRAKGHVISK